MLGSGVVWEAAEGPGTLRCLGGGVGLRPKEMMRAQESLSSQSHPCSATSQGTRSKGGGVRGWRSGGSVETELCLSHSASGIPRGLGRGPSLDMSCCILTPLYLKLCGDRDHTSRECPACGRHSGYSKKRGRTPLEAWDSMHALIQTRASPPACRAVCLHGHGGAQPLV